MENASSPYVILNRPSAVWTPVIDREKETQQHVGVKVRARSIPRVSLTVGCFSNAARASAPRGIGAIRARFTPKPREPGRVRDDPAPRGGMGASARAIEDAGGVPPDLPSPSSPFSALRRHEPTPLDGFSWEKSRPTASLVFTEMPAGTCRGRFFSPERRRAREPEPEGEGANASDRPAHVLLSTLNTFFSFVTRTHRSTASVRAAGAVCT